MANAAATLSLITLDRYLRMTTPANRGETEHALEHVALAVKRISNELTAAALRGELGLSGETNVQGEKVEKLDTWSNDVFLDSFAGGHPICTLISEEIEEPQHPRRSTRTIPMRCCSIRLTAPPTPASTARSGRSLRCAGASPAMATM